MSNPQFAVFEAAIANRWVIESEADASDSGHPS